MNRVHFAKTNGQRREYQSDSILFFFSLCKCFLSLRDYESRLGIDGRCAFTGWKEGTAQGQEGSSARTAYPHLRRFVDDPDITRYVAVEDL